MASDRTTNVKQEIKLSFGIRDNKIVCISELKENERGLNCNCFCPSCGQALIARLGKIKQHHFAHKAESCDLRTSQQTALHLLAKDIIEQEKSVQVPGISVSISEIIREIPEMSYYKRRFFLPDSLEYKEAKIITCDSVVLEKKISDIVPDIIVRKGEHVCLIEIAVTHFVDEEKKEKIKRLGLPVLEIDLSKMSFDLMDRNMLKKMIVDGLDNKKWVYNPKIDEAKIWAKGEYKKKVDEYLEKKVRHERKLKEHRDKEFDRIPCDYHTVPSEHNYDYEAEEQRRKEQEKEFKALLKEVENADFNSTEIIRDSKRNRWVKCKHCNTVKIEYDMASYGGGGPQIGTCKECDRRNNKLGIF